MTPRSYCKKVRSLQSRIHRTLSGADLDQGFFLPEASGAHNNNDNNNNKNNNNNNNSCYYYFF